MSSDLWSEYKLIYEVYEGYNQQVLMLKGWSVSIGIAALIAAYAKPVSGYGRTAILIAAFSAIPFWLTETLWKLFQRTTLERIKEIEICFREDPDKCKPAQITTSWDESFVASKWEYWLEGAFDLHVLFPHLALLLIGVALAIWHPPVLKSENNIGENSP